MAYGLTNEKAVGDLTLPDLTYLPRDPVQKLGIGLIGCGGISEYHCAAYQRNGYPVLALLDHTRAKAEQRARLFPEARVVNSLEEILAIDAIRVVDVTAHPEPRRHLIERAIGCGKHVLSQKPFVLNLDDGKRLVRLAAEAGVKLAVNQNGRWAPHLSFLAAAVQAGLIGRLNSLDFRLNFDHSWVAGTRYDRDPHLLLFDFGIHWIDQVARLFRGRQIERIYANAVRSASQTPVPGLLGSVQFQLADGLATLTLNGDTRFAQSDETTVVGATGTMQSRGPNLSTQRLEVVTSEGRLTVPLTGTWFENGFHGAMAELQCAIEEHREPDHGARDNLRTLELAYATCASALRGEPVKPGEVGELPV